MPTKITLIIDNPDDVSGFEAQFPALLEQAAALPGLPRLESAKVWPKEDGTPTPEYRTLDLYFADYDAASAAVAADAAGAFFGALFEATSGSFTGLFSDIEAA
jgi:hypothetical protein